MEPASSWILAGFVPAEPQWNSHGSEFLPALAKRKVRPEKKRSRSLRKATRVTVLLAEFKERVTFQSGSHLKPLRDVYLCVANSSPHSGSQHSVS